MQIVLATRNQHKKQELVALLSGLDITIRTLEDFPEAPEVVEDGETCEANAMKKAVEIAHFTGLPAVADDTGLEVDALGGRTGSVCGSVCRGACDLRR
ncbi:MAG: non-canonical purine NTP pyrophosphatase [Nitrospira sp.]